MVREIIPNGMNEPDYPDLSISQSCKRLSIARSSISYTPKGGTEQNLDLMRRIGSKPSVLVYWQKVSAGLLAKV